MNAYDELLHQTLLVASLLSLPILALAMVVGTAIAVLQAATSLQEQSLGVLPKIGIVGAVLAMSAPLGVRLVSDLFHAAIAAIPAIVAG